MRATQLIIGSLTLPHVSNDRYRCWAEELKEQKVMISGRMVEEVRGVVQRITWSSDYLEPETKDAILAALRGGNPTLLLTALWLCAADLGDLRRKWGKRVVIRGRKG